MVKNKGRNYDIPNEIIQKNQQILLVEKGLLMKSTVMIISFFFFTIQSTSLSTSFENESILESKRMLKEGSIIIDTSLILQARKNFIREYRKEPTSLCLYLIAQSEYELIRIGIAQKESGLFEKYFESAVDRVEHLIEKEPDWSEPYALISSIYGYKIAHNWINAVTYGPKAFISANNALKLDEKNPRAWLVKGTTTLHMPALLGGGADGAIIELKKAIELYENQKISDQLTPDWGYIDALVWLGWAYEKKDQPLEAMGVYQKAIREEPRAGWISSMFLEPLQKKNMSIKKP